MWIDCMTVREREYFGNIEFLIAKCYQQPRGLGSEPPGVWAFGSYQDKHRGLESELFGMKIAVFRFRRYPFNFPNPSARCGRDPCPGSRQVLPVQYSPVFLSRHNLRNGVFRESTILIWNFWSQKYHSSSKNEKFEKNKNCQKKNWNFPIFCWPLWWSIFFLVTEHLWKTS